MNADYGINVTTISVDQMQIRTNVIGQNLN